MPADFKPVYSSWVAAIGYDDEARTFIVRHQDGSETHYLGVPIEKAREIWHAPSVGEALHRHIRGQHDFRTVKP